MLAIIAGSRSQLVELGYEDVAIESFHDLMVELLEGLFEMSREGLLAAFQESGNSDHYTWFMRLLTAGAMRAQAGRFLPFISDDVAHHSVTLPEDDEEASRAIRRYCQQEVEPMGRECEQVHVIALAETLNVVIHIEYLDGRPFDPKSGLYKVVFNEAAEDGFQSQSSGTSERRRRDYFVRAPVTLLYRPGHFDILYPRG